MERKELSLDEVRHIAELAKLSVSDEERERYRAQLVKIFEYISQIDQMHTDGVVEAHHPTMDVTNVLREDTVDAADTFSQAECLANSSAVHDGYFRVGGILNKLDS